LERINNSKKSLERSQLSHTLISDSKSKSIAVKVVRRISKIFVKNNYRRRKERTTQDEQESPNAIPQSTKAERRISFKSVKRRVPSNDSGKDVNLNMTQAYKLPAKNLNTAKKVRISLVHLQKLIKEKISSKQLRTKRNPAIRISKSKAKQFLSNTNPLLKDLSGAHEEYLNTSIKDKIRKSNVNDIFPLSVVQTLKLFGKELSTFEKSEMLDYDIIYYLGNGVEKLNFDRRTGYDDDQNDYNTYVGEHINYRYEILDILGKGSFGQTLKCIDHKKQQLVAVKIIKSQKKLYQQAILEVKVLKYIKDHDTEGKANVVQILDSFIFRNHVVNL
jgi:hypothetical protein